VSLLDSLFGRKKVKPAPEAHTPASAPKKPNRFRADAERFAQRCLSWNDLLAHAQSSTTPASLAPHVGVVVSPWISTPVPFFSMECALALRRAGLRVSLLWDGMEIVGNVPNKKHIEVIAGVFPSLPQDLHLIDVSQTPLPPVLPGTPVNDADAQAARRIIYENAVRNVRGEMNVDTFFAAHPDAGPDTLAHFARIRQTLATGRFDWLLVPGGIFGVSAVYLEIARQLDLPFSTFDSGPGRLRLVHQGVAAHLADLPRAFEIVNAQLTEPQKSRARALGRQELEKRTQGSDDRGFQVAPATGARHPCDILIPLNIRWDSAALSRQRLFASVEENIAAVLHWADARPGITVCIRQHPNERRDHLRGSDNWETLVQRFAHMGDRVRWIGAAEPVSTYDLIRAARVVLPHTSTVGIEAAFLGTPVVLSTRVYYDTFSFVRNPATRQDFFALLDQALAGALTVSDESKAEAALAYFMTQQCAVMRTRFTPQNDDFTQWMETAPDLLWQEPEPTDFLTALRTREPLAALRARRLLA
jgi:hypothetical protein